MERPTPAIENSNDGKIDRFPVTGIPWLVSTDNSCKLSNIILSMSLTTTIWIDLNSLGFLDYAPNWS